jgi:hypothetical protein
MDKEVLEQQINLAVARYVGKREPAVREEMVLLSLRLTEFEHLAMLENAVGRCRSEDMRKPEVKNALRDLATVMTDPWPIKQLLEVFNNENDEGRWQLANAALNAIRTYVSR